MAFRGPRGTITTPPSHHEQGGEIELSENAPRRPELTAMEPQKNPTATKVNTAESPSDRFERPCASDRDREGRYEGATPSSSGHGRIKIDAAPPMLEGTPSTATPRPRGADPTISLCAKSRLTPPRECRQALDG